MFELESAIRTWRREFRQQQALTDKALDELEDHLRSDYEAHMATGLSSEEAFALSRERLGQPSELSPEFKKVEGRGWRRLIIAGWSLFAISFFLPVHTWGITLWHNNIGDGVVPGVQAFLAALSGEAGVIGVLSAGTNFVMVLTAWSLSARARNVRPFAAATIVAALLNGWWLYEVETIANLRIGYFLWLASFGLVGTGLVMKALSGRRVAARQTVT
ncbi:MAG: permease prefix domain 1-containing protein [Gemmatimonadales bacterium]